MTGSFLKVGLLTISDRAYKGEYEDQSGVAMKKWLQYKQNPQYQKQRYSVILRFCKKFQLLQ